MVERILLGNQRKRLLGRIKDLGRLPGSVWKRTGALNTWGTNAIEGGTLTQDDVERLLIQGESVAGRPTSDIVEAVQHEAAFLGLLKRRRIPIDLVAVQDLHEEVFRGLPAYRPGQWRLSNPFIAGTTYRPPRREKVVVLLDDWIRTYRAHPGGDVFESAARFHHGFEAIHPFENGNGRVGRLVLNLHFLRHDWPPVHILPADRKAYLAALEAGHQADYGPLARLLAHAMSRSLLDLLDQVGRASDRLRPLAEFNQDRWNPYSAHYLSLRARQGVLAALHARHWSAPPAARRNPGRPMYLTSETALRHYLVAHGRRRPRRTGFSPRST